MGTRHEDGHNKDARFGVSPRCPRCGNALSARLVEVEDQGEDKSEALVLVDCPKGDFHATVTREDIAATLMAAVRERLGF